MIFVGLYYACGFPAEPAAENLYILIYSLLVQPVRYPLFHTTEELYLYFAYVTSPCGPLLRPAATKKRIHPKLGTLMLDL